MQHHPHTESKPRAVGKVLTGGEESRVVIIPPAYAVHGSLAANALASQVCLIPDHQFSSSEASENATQVHLLPKVSALSKIFFIIFPSATKIA